MKFIINRFDGQKRYDQTYELNLDDIKGKTLLGVLQFIKQTQDITLNFTASCRMAICGACAVRVNGHSYLACDAKMTQLLKEYENPDSFTISPLANFRVISDLVVDWEPSIENLRKIKPTITPKDEFSEHKGCKQTAAQMEEVKKQWDCILCGCCASECNKLTADASDYMEPFVFTHAWRAAADSRSKNPLEHLKPAIDNGLWNCVHCQECADRCPKGISTADDIASLSVMAMKNGFDDGLGPDHAEAFLTDIIEGGGRLNEIKLALRSEGVIKNMGKMDIAANLMMAGKMNPLTNLKAALFYGCHSLRPEKAYGNKESSTNPKSFETVVETLGAQIVAFEKRLDCCGFHASYPAVKSVQKMSSQIVGNADENGADCVVTPCPLCQMQLDIYQDRYQEAQNSKVRKPIIHLSQLVGLALGLSNEQLGLDINIVDATELA